jgi:TM2 domain-containing membrane protein YozV
MKKLILGLALIGGLFTTNFASASAYKADDASIDVLFDNSIDITTTVNEMALGSMMAPQSVTGDQSVGGYLVRSLFCGFIGLHRSYMGTGGKSVWWFYLCLGGLGITNCFDFWWVVFKGSDAMEKYRDNGKLMVWAGK